MKIGFIGYGEAARAIAEGLQENGLAREDVYGWSRSLSKADPATINVTRAESKEEIFKLCKVVICNILKFNFVWSSQKTFCKCRANYRICKFPNSTNWIFKSTISINHTF